LYTSLLLIRIAEYFALLFRFTEVLFIGLPPFCAPVQRLPMTYSHVVSAS